MHNVDILCFGDFLSTPGQINTSKTKTQLMWGWFFLLKYYSYLKSKVRQK